MPDFKGAAFQIGVFLRSGRFLSGIGLGEKAGLLGKMATHGLFTLGNPDVLRRKEKLCFA